VWQIETKLIKNRTKTILPKLRTLWYVLSTDKRRDVMTAERRLSIRAVAMRYGLPPKVVSRSVASGDLPAVVVPTDTGRERAYISPEDADHWFRGLLTTSSVGSSSFGGSE